MAMQLGGGLGGGHKTRFPDNADMNVTPFVDVMLVLLIIFMVAAPLATVNVKVELPPPTDTPIEKKEVSIFISMQESGKIFIGDGVTEKEALLADLPKEMEVISLGNKTTIRVFLRADQEVVYNKVMEMMNLVQDQGYEKVGIVSEEVVDE
jgi:biopolymer transport protein ExbD